MLRNVLAWVERCKAALALAEYEIEIALVPGLEDLGLCIVDPTYQIAKIAIRDPVDGTHDDWERTVLHELVHVRMGGALGTEPGSEERSALERGVEMMTRVIYKMIKGGASRKALSDAARLCARTITTAREGLSRGNMDPGKLIEAGAKIGEIRGREDVPDDVKGMLDEIAAIISEAAGGALGPESAPGPAEKDPIDPMVPAMKPEEEQMYRKLLGDVTVDTFRANTKKLMRAQMIQLARTSLGDKLTPHDEARLNAMNPREGAAYIEGLKRGAGKQGALGVTLTPKNEPPVADKKTVTIESLLKSGESLDGATGTKRVAIEVLETRAATRGLKIGKVA